MNFIFKEKKRNHALQIGDIVVCKANGGLQLVVNKFINENEVWCTHWNAVDSTFESVRFDYRELQKV